MYPKNLESLGYFGLQQIKTEVNVPADKAQRHCCHHRCLIATVPEKIHKAWPLASYSMNSRLLQVLLCFTSVCSGYCSVLPQTIYCLILRHSRNSQQGEKKNKDNSSSITAKSVELNPEMALKIYCHLIVVKGEARGGN